MKKRYFAAIIFLVVFMTTMFFLTHFTKSLIHSVDGYVVSDDSFSKVLLSGNKQAKSDNVRLTKVSYSDTFYTNLGNTYVGDNKKKLVNTTYPIFSNKGISLVNMSAKSKLINSDFIFSKGYPNFTITDGKLYNYNDHEQADYDQYILLQLSNMIYINLGEIKLNTNTEEYTIPLNSVLSFENDHIKYYYYSDGFLVYKIIDGISLDNTINIGNTSFLYEKLLTEIGKVSFDTEDGSKEDDFTSSDNDVKEDNSNKDTDNENTESSYVKPTVKCDSFKANVYSITSNLKIDDPSHKIVEAITFIIKEKNKIYLRKGFLSSGKIEINGLKPNTEYTISGSYKYYNEEEKKMEVEFFSQDLKTLDVSKLDSIDIDYSNGSIYSNKINIKGLKISTSLTNEVIKGINKVCIYIDNEKYFISALDVNKLLSGQAINYLSLAKLKSNSRINYEIRIYDSYDNLLKVNNATGTSRTSKEEPTSSVKIVKNETNEVEFLISLKNNDSVNVANYRYNIYNKNNELVESKKINKDKETVKVKNLNPTTLYKVEVLGDFDTEDGLGVKKDNLMGEASFTTGSLSSLGSLRITSNIEDGSLTSDSVKIKTELNLNKTSAILTDLLNSLELKIVDTDGNIYYQKMLSSLELDKFKSGEVLDSQITNLKSATKYNVLYTGVLKQGDTLEDITVLSTLENFKTLKNKAIVQIDKKFVTSSMIDYDVRVDDLDNSILSNRVLLEVRDSNLKLIAKEELDVNDAYKELTYDKLEANENYHFVYKVEKYNEGYDNTTFQSDYIIYEEDIVTEEGVTGKIELTSLLRQITSDNLFNIEDYSRIRKEGSGTGSKDYNLGDNTVTFSTKNGWSYYSYFVPEAYNKKVNVTFYAKYDDNTQNTSNAYLGTSYYSSTYNLSGLNKSEWKKYSYTFTLTSNYICFAINETSGQNKITSVNFKDINIVLMDNIVTDAKKDISSSYYSSDKIFTDTKMISGNDSMPSHDGNSKITGNSSNGYAKITDLDSNKVYSYDYTGTYQTFTTPKTGKYKIELWGAQGGGEKGGKGAYTSGIIQLKSNEKLYVYVGQEGSLSNSSSFNGGGSGVGSLPGVFDGYSGGGATDVRLESGSWSLTSSLKSRIMVAAGGGASCNSISGGYGGSINGGIGVKNDSSYLDAITSSGATQSSGGKVMGCTTFYSNGSFGMGGSSLIGGGGGYYGGASGCLELYEENLYILTGAGGSSYISGHLGCLSQYFEATYKKYSEDKQYEGIFNIDLYDSREEIITNDYYVRIYKADELVETHKYDLDSKKIEDVVKKYKFDKNKNYTVKLSIKIRDRFYDISSVSFNTSSEIRAIRTVYDFQNMHPSGKYIVLNDLDFTNSSGYGYVFYGSIDFLGHTVKRDTSPAYMFYQIGSGAVVSNVVVDMIFNNTSPIVYNNYVAFAKGNYGIIDNIMVNVIEATSQANDAFSLISIDNYGTIKNFVINSKVSIYARSRLGLVSCYNKGIIKNGYVYGQNINATFTNLYENRKLIGVIAGQNESNSIIENVYSLISVDKDSSLSSENVVGNIVGYNKNGTLKNAYSSEGEINTNILSRDPNIGEVSSINVNNLYYSSDKSYSTSYSSKVSKMALYDNDFQSKVLNDDNGFIIDKFVSLGYFPQVDFNEVMPNQEWISLPNINNQDLVDVTSINILSNDGDSAKVELVLNNPSAAKVTSVGITDISDVKIISQDDYSGKSKVVINLENPSSYKSTYYLRSLTVKEVLNLSYDVTYGQTERPINVDLYYPIKNLEDFKIINQNPSQNYILKADLDFSDSVISKYVISSSFTGKLNGNGHTIKNIKSTTPFFSYLYKAVIENLFVENFSLNAQESNYYSAFFGNLSNSTINNVHMKDVNISNGRYIGGLVGYASNSTIQNSSVNEFNNSKTSNSSSVSIGGLIGSLNTSNIYNCFVCDNEIKFNGNGVIGIGGLVGNTVDSNIENVYATGTIETNSYYAGGIVGYSNTSNGVYLTDKLINAWSKVNIISSLDYVGGIYGFFNYDNFSNTLVLGNVYSLYSASFVHRTSGNVSDLVKNNYAWDRQEVNGYVTDNVTSEVLLSTEQLLDKNTYYDLMSFADNFNYDGIENGLMPKLVSRDKDKVLPNQDDVKLQSGMFEVNNIVVDATVNDATIYLELNNPDNLDVTGIEFDNLDVSKISKLSSMDGVTVIEVKVLPNKYYDSYTLTKINYIDSNGKKKSYNRNSKIELQFFKSLSKFEDWQSISSTTTENYRLTADIDFAGKSNINTNVSMARLEGVEGKNYSLKNITLTSTSADYSLINKITTTLKNVTFDNININVTSSGSNVGVIITNYADIENVNFNNITINAPSVNYVGPIVYYSTALGANNIGAVGNNITGNNYVGGVIAYTAYDSIDNVVCDNLTVYGYSYVGGVIGSINLSSSNYNNYTVSNMNVNGRSSVGGIFGRGSGKNLKISDSSIVGRAGGSAIGGIIGANNGVAFDTAIADSISVLAKGNSYVGGVIGNGFVANNTYVLNSSIVQEGNYSYVGGILGYSYSTSNVGIVNSTVKSSGNHTGGIAGMREFYTSTGAIVNNTTVSGTNYVGGSYGTISTCTVSEFLINATVFGTGNYVGGFAGNIDAVSTESNYSANINSVIVANSEITGNNYVGGFAGSAAALLPSSIFYNILLVDNVNSTGSYVGSVTGKDKTFNTINTKFYAYNKNQINDEVAKDILDYNSISSSNYLSASDLLTQSTYTNRGFSTSDWDFSNLSNGYYPKVKYVNNQIDIKLPTDIVMFRARRMVSLYKHELPSINVYSSGVNSINLEFSESDIYTYFDVYENDKLVISHDLDRRVFSLNYNYKSKLKIVISDGTNRNIKFIYPEDVIHKVSTYDDKYAYIYEEQLKGNVSSIDDKVIHIYGDKVLTDNLDVYSIGEEKYLSKDNKYEVSLLSEVVPLFEFSYDNKVINTYYNYSEIITAEEKLIYENQLFVKNGNIEIVDYNLDNKKDCIIIDNYSDNNYVTVLGVDGVLYNLKSAIKLPVNFSNKNISEISNNINSNSSIVLVLYENGKVVAVDYRTGKEETLAKADINTTFAEYFKDSISYRKAAINSSLTNNYEESLALVDLLEDNPIEEDSEGNYTKGSIDKKNDTTTLNSGYISYYNSISNKYDVVKLNEVINCGDDVVVENNKIYSSPELVNIYMNESIFEKIFGNINIVVVFIVILISIICSLILWIVNVKKLKFEGVK